LESGATLRLAMPAAELARLGKMLVQLAAQRRDTGDG
jgi:hypothetical protein